MRWNALLHTPYEPTVEPPRRWWLGWLQLLCAWVLCMLLCANIALVLAKGLPEVRGEATVDGRAGCTAAAIAAPSDAKHVKQVDPTRGRAPAC